MHSEQFIMKNDINVISLTLKDMTYSSLKFYHVSHVDVEKFESSDPYVLWILGNEEHKNFDYKFNDKNCKAIVKPYPYIKDYNPVSQPYIFDEQTKKILVKTDKEDPRVLNIPLGQTKNFKALIAAKEFDVGFYGQLSGIRNAILPHVPKAKIFTYQKFGISRDGDEYSKFLSKCNISFCPTGQSPETYRLYESSLSGCILLGNPLPNTDYYRECPIFAVPWQQFNQDNKENLNSLIENILINKQRYQSDSLAWATKWTSADYIEKLIIQHLKTIGA